MPPLFLADEMLGALARWLRVCGHDVEYARDVDDETLIQMASNSGRHLLTRDVFLARRYQDSLLLHSLDAMEQLRTVLDHYDIKIDMPRARCSLCNGELREVTRTDVSTEVPEASLAAFDEFYRCRNCGKVYWHGSHWQDMESKLARLRNDDSSRG